MPCLSPRLDPVKRYLPSLGSCQSGWFPQHYTGPGVTGHEISAVIELVFGDLLVLIPLSLFIEQRHKRVTCFTAQRDGAGTLVYAPWLPSSIPCLPLGVTEAHKLWWGKRGVMAHQGQRAGEARGCPSNGPAVPGGGDTTQAIVGLPKPGLGPQGQAGRDRSECIMLRSPNKEHLKPALSLTMATITGQVSEPENRSCTGALLSPCLWAGRSFNTSGCTGRGLQVCS